MVAGNRLRHPVIARSFALLLALSMLLSGAPAGAPPARADDGNITVHAWTCPIGFDPSGVDPAAFAAACTTPADGLQFAFSNPADPSTSLTVPTGYPASGDPSQVSALFFPRVSIALTEPQPGADAAAFCTVSGTTKPQQITDGVTLVLDQPVPPEGFACDWYVIPSPEPTATPEPTPTLEPTATLEPSPTATTAPAPTVAPSPATAPATPVEATAEPATPLPERPPIELDRPLKITALPLTSGANISKAMAINDAGEIAGASGYFGENGLEWQDAVRWTNGGETVETLTPLPGAAINEAAAINDKGQIVGWGQLPDGTVHAVLWEDGVPQDLGVLPGGTDSQALGINNAGQVVGRSTTAPDQEIGGDGAHAFLWQDDSMTDLGVLDGKTKSYAIAINDSSVIVGQSSGATAIWTPPDFQIDSFGSGAAVALTSAGAVTGLFLAEDGYVHSFLWRGDDRIDLGTLPDWHGRPWAVNEGEVVVGFGCRLPACPEGDEKTALLWLNGTVYEMQELLSKRSSSRWILQSATGINDTGLIVGYGFYDGTPDDGTDNGTTRAFLIESKAAYSTIEGEEPPDVPTPVPTKEIDAEPPREISYNDEFYLMDRRIVMSRAGLNELTAYQGFTLYGRGTEPPFGALYVPVSRNPRDGLYRYLPARIALRDQQCPAEAKPVPLTLQDGSVYIYAGIEPDLTGASMTQLSGDYYFETGASTPLPEIYKFVNGQFERYIHLSKEADAPVPQIAPGLRFGGQAWAYRETIPNDAAARAQAPVRVGCAGPFKISTEVGQDTLGALTKIYIEVGTQVYVFNVTITQQASVVPGGARTASAPAASAILPLAVGLIRARARRVRRRAARRGRRRTAAHFGA